MNHRPMQKKRNQQIVDKTLIALGDISKEVLVGLNTPQPVQRIESLIRFDVSESELSTWRNDGWQVQHYQFMGNALAVVLERTIEVTPAPMKEAVEVTAADSHSQLEIEKTPPFTIELPADEVAQDTPAPIVTIYEPALAEQPNFATALRNPHMTAADVIAAGNAQILDTARSVYKTLQPTIEKYVEQPFEVTHG